MNAGCRVPERHQLLRTRIGKRLEQNTFYHAEDRGRRADSERESEQRDRCESWCGTETAARVPQVQEDSRGRVFPTVGTQVFAQVDGRSEFQAYPPACLAGREAAGHPLGGSLIEIVFNLVALVALGGPAMEERREAARELAPERHLNLRL